MEDQEDIIFLANDDIIIDDIEFIERALKTLKKNKKSLLTSTGYDNETKVISDGPINLNYITYKEQILKSYSKANCASTRALFLRVGDFLNIGGFKPKLLPHYGSDYEFTIRAHRKGFKIIGDENLCYLYSNRTSGNLTYMDEDPKNFIKKLFSKKSIYNPFYYVIYIFLTCPKYLLPIALSYKFSRYIRNLSKYLIKVGKPYV